MAEVSTARPPTKPKGLSRPVISSRLPKAFSQASILKPAIPRPPKVLLSPLQANREQHASILKALKRLQLKNQPMYLKTWSARLEDVITFAQVAASRTGVVKKGLHAPTLKMLAVKQLPLSTREARHSLSQWLVQWQDLQAKNSQLLQVHAAFWNSPEGCVSLLCEYLSGGSLLSLADSAGALPEEALADIARQALATLAYLHSKNTAHGQMCPGQVLLARTGSVKLGLGLRAKVQGKAIVGDDIYGLGATLIAAACGDLEVAGLAAGGPCCLYHSLKAELMYPELTRFSPSFQDFLCKCSHHDPSQRPKGETLLTHPWLYEAHYPGPRVSLSELLAVTYQWVVPEEFREAGEVQLARICEALGVVLSGKVEPAWEWAEDLAADLGLSPQVVDSQVRTKVSFASNES